MDLSYLYCVAIFRRHFDGMRKAQDKYRAYTNRTFNSNCSSMIQHNFTADSKPNPVPTPIITSMQTLKNLENALTIFLSNTNTVILHSDLDILFVFLRCDTHNW